MNKVEAFIMSIPYIKAINREELMITVFDHEKYLYYSPTKELNFHYQVGSKLPEIYMDYAMVNKSGPVILSIPAEEFGIPFDSINIPIKDDRNNMIGAINVAISTQKTVLLNDIIESVERVALSLQIKVESISTNSSRLTEKTGEMAEKTSAVTTYSKEISSVASAINMISEQTNLLGLNAAIEAARVGKDGAGFGVVANEIRKLSKDSKDATSTIEGTIKNITSSLEMMEKTHDDLVTSAKEEVDLVRQFLNDIEQLQKTAENIRTYYNDYVDVKE